MTCPEIYLVSACLMGLRTRFDGRLITNPECLAELLDAIWIPVCPEQLGGLPTPRAAADIVGGGGHEVLEGKARVITRAGQDVTEQFLLGAEQVLEIASSQGIMGIFFKSRSPSCGVTPQPGVTAALLIKNGYIVREF